MALMIRPVNGASIAVVVPTDGLRLRAGPSAENRVIDLIPGGTRLAIPGSATENGWYPAVYRGQRGWVMGAFLAFDDLTAAAARPATVKADDGLNLRAAPVESAEVLAVLTNGSSVTATGQATSDGWALVQVAEKSGWAKASFLSFEGAPAPTSAFSAASVPSGATQRVTVRFYHPSFEGSRMNCGGTYRADDPTIAATNSWPCGTNLRICRDAACIVVTVRDRGGMESNEIDLSAAGFARLSPLGAGVLSATAEVVNP